MGSNDKLQHRPQKLELINGDRISLAVSRHLTASQQALAMQLEITAENAKTTISAALASAWNLEFSEEYSPAEIEEAFRRWRRNSRFFPTISEMRAQFSVCGFLSRSERDEMAKEAAEIARRTIEAAEAKEARRQESLKRQHEIEEFKAAHDGLTPDDVQRQEQAKWAQERAKQYAETHTALGYTKVTSSGRGVRQFTEEQLKALSNKLKGD